MRPSILTVSAALLAALALGGCTSGDPDSTDDPTEDAAATSEDGLDGVASENGWFCNYIGPDDVVAALGGEPQTPRELQVQDDDKAWICEVLSGGRDEQEPVARLTIIAADEPLIAELKERASGAEGVTTGPDHLGESYVSPGMISSFMPCVAPGATDREDKAPYAFAVESLVGKDQATDDALRKIMGRVVINLDQTVGCSPKMALQDDGSATTAP